VKIRRHYIKRMELYLLIIWLLLPLVVKDALFRHLMVMGGIYAIAALGLSLFMGYAGQISIGHSAFFGLGAYAMAVLTLHCAVPPAAALLAAGAVSGVAALALGRPLLKLREYFLALATIGLVPIFQACVRESPAFTGGVIGLSDVPWFALGGLHFNSALKQFYLVWGLLYVLFVFGRNLVHSKYGRAALLVARSEETASTLGVNPASLKLKFLVLSAVYAGVAGGLFACVLTSVNPDSFGIGLSTTLVMMVIVGGMGSLGGTIAAAVLLTWVMHALGTYREFSLMLQGLIIIGLLVFLPEGLFRGIGSRWFGFVRTYADENWRKKIEK
jgi:branched-chain amino acid transport system permease protein